MKLKLRNTMRKSQQELEEAFHPINLDYIFDEHDPLNPWLEESEAPLLDGQDLDWLNDEDNEQDPIIDTTEQELGVTPPFRYSVDSPSVDGGESDKDDDSGDGGGDGGGGDDMDDDGDDGDDDGRGFAGDNAGGGGGYQKPIGTTHGYHADSNYSNDIPSFSDPSSSLNIPSNFAPRQHEFGYEISGGESSSTSTTANQDYGFSHYMDPFAPLRYYGMPSDNWNQQHQHQNYPSRFENEVNTSQNYPNNLPEFQSHSTAFNEGSSFFNLFPSQMNNQNVDDYSGEPSNQDPPRHSFWW